MSAHSYRETLKHRGLQPFLWTQFLGAFNDNFFKFVVTMVAVHTAVDEAASGRNVSLVGIVFIAPFLLFSGYAGQLADAFSKRTVLVVTQVARDRRDRSQPVRLRVGTAGAALRRAVPDRGAGDVLQPGEVRNPARDAARARPVARQRRAGDEHVRRDRGGRRRGDGGLRGVARPPVAGRRHGGRRLRSSASPRASAFRACRRPRLRRASASTRGATSRSASSDLLRDRVLLLTVVGICPTSGSSARCCSSVMVLFGSEVDAADGHVDRRCSRRPPRSASAIGSLAAGRLSGDKVELGLAPIGAFGMGLFALGLSLCTHSAIAAAATLTLRRLLRRPVRRAAERAAPAARIGARTKGRLMATNNFVNMIAIMMASGALWLCQSKLRHGADSTSIVVFGDPHAGVERLRAGARARVLRPLLPLAADAHDLPHPDRRRRTTCRSRDRRCWSATTCRTWTAS